MSPTKQNNLVTLREMLNKFFNLSELYDLCFDLYIDPENLPAQTKQDTIRELLLFLIQHKRLDELLVLVQKVRPNELWPEISLSDQENFLELSPQQKKGAIYWATIRKTCERISAPRLDFLAQKFDPEVYDHRESIQKHINRFLKQREKNYLFLVGNSGVGKSAFLWGAVERIKDNSDVAFLFCDASIHLDDSQSATDKLLGDLSEVIGMPVSSLLQTVNSEIKSSKRSLIIIIDGINEFQSMIETERILRGFHKYTVLYPWIKILISCRPHFWIHVNNQKSLIGISDRYFYTDESFFESSELFVPFKELNDDEIAILYRKYQAKYGFFPEHWASLESKIREKLREPLNLWLVSEICEGQNLNKMADSLLLDLDTIPKFIAKLRERGDLAQNKEDDLFLEQEFPKFLVHNGFCQNYVMRNRLVSDEKIANIENILRRLIRSGILKEDSVQRISFSFERFHGFYFGKYLRHLIHTDQKLDC